jgi:predicted DNA-binding mobile mystery protein A
MTVKSTARRHRQEIVNRAAAEPQAPEGWIATVRTALGMSREQLAQRLGLKRGRIFQAEQSEVDGVATLKTMQAAAEAMGCQFVYAIVPKAGKIEDVIAAQARKKARAIVARTAGTMGLEGQALPVDKYEERVERLAQDMIGDMPRDLWSDE